MTEPEEKIEDAPEEVEEQLTVPEISLHACFIWCGHSLNHASFWRNSRKAITHPH